MIYLHILLLLELGLYVFVILICMHNLSCEINHKIYKIIFKYIKIN